MNSEERDREIVDRCVWAYTWTSLACTALAYRHKKQSYRSHVRCAANCVLKLESLGKKGYMEEIRGFICSYPVPKWSKRKESKVEGDILGEISRLREEEAGLSKGEIG